MKSFEKSLAWLLVLTQSLFAVPLRADGVERGAPSMPGGVPGRPLSAMAAPAVDDSRVPAAEAAVSAASPSWNKGSASQTPPGPKIRVNRTVPKVTPVPLRPIFSAVPTAAEITRARVFEEPLVAIAGSPTAEQNIGLARAIGVYVASDDRADMSPFEALLEAHAAAPWRASLLLNVGLVYVRTGRPTRALRVLAEAWDLSREATDPAGRALADRAVSERIRMLARLGLVGDVQKALEDVGDRKVAGTAGELLREGREAIQLMKYQPGSSLRCGLIALDNVLGHGKAAYRTDQKIAQYEPGHWGTTLAELHELSRQIAPEYRMARRVDLSSPVLVPAVVHWSLGHFAALVEERDGKYLLQDPVFGEEMWISRKAFDDEMSGYSLVAAETLPRGWREVGAEEAGQVWGRGTTQGPQTDNTKPCSTTSGGDGCPCQCGPGKGMATYSVHSMMVSLTVIDTPVGYQPPRGPGVGFTVRYIQRDAFQPQIFSYWNFGTRWTSDWLSYVTDNPGSPTQPVKVYLRGGGQETYSGYDAGTSSYAPHFESRAVMARTSSSPIVYQRRLGDGSFEEYTQPDGASSFPRKVFLTRIVDAQGNALTLTYDSSLRLVGVTDAVGQVTTLTYELASDPLKVTAVSDPFGRTAHFDYDASGHLERITDVIGLESQFEYSETVPDFIEALTTPYGRTSFATGESGTDRWIEMTDPLGGKEKIAYANTTSAFPSEPVPQGGFSGNYLQYRNTFYWDKRAYASGVSQDFTKAQVLHWPHTPDGTLTSGVLESQKKPLENRVWYLYPGQGDPWMQGSDAHPIAVGRVLDDGTTQRWQYQHNSRGKKVKEIDPLGRETVYVYGTDNVPDADPAAGGGLDLLEVKRKNGASYDVLWSATYDAQHQPLTVTDALGRTTTYTYNAAGQVLTVTTPPAQGHAQGATTTFAYDTDGYLTQVSGPVPGATTTFTYDTIGRRRTVTDAAGLTLTYDYDALDRVTRVTYPDGTYEETAYNRLDAEKRRDRLGQWTQTLHDALRRPVATRDAAGGATQYQYSAAGCYACAGGGDRLTKLVDAKGNTTAWDYDLQGRLTTEMREDGRIEAYTYETTTSRLKTKTDRKGLTTTYAYAPDGKLTGKTYSDTTPAVSYTFDPVSGLMLTAGNGTDTLTWTYDPLDRVATEASTKNASTVGYTYDDAGNRATLSLDGTTHVSYGYDQQSRLTGITRVANTITFGYDTASRRTSMTYPNGVVTTYGYDTESRLTSLVANKGSTPITSFSYALDAVGNRRRKTTLDWAEDYGYDALYRLTSADRSAGTPSRFRYAYDAVGNRIADQTDDASMGATHNSLNQLTRRQPGGMLAFVGATNEPAAVTVASKPAQTAADNNFRGQAAVGTGTTDVTVTATDPSSNVRTNTYRVTQAGATTTYTYDPNGNLSTKTEGSDTWVYSWNAENQLTKVEKNGAEQARFAYDPSGRRVEKVAGGITSSYTYDSLNVVREVRGGSTLKYVYSLLVDELLAVDAGTAMSYIHGDSLGSIVAVTDAAGAVTSTRKYDAWGNLQVGADQPGFAFTGREWDPEPGLYYYRARYYDANAGRFLSEDPAGLVDGPNRYAYVRNNPSNAVDPTGEFCIPCVIAVGAIVGVLTASTANAPGPGDQTWPSDTGGGTMAGAAGGAAAAAAAQQAWAAIAPWVWKWVKDGRCIVDLHPPHHSFPSMGGRRCWHISITCYIKGCKGSDVRMQIPIPGTCI